MTNPKEMERLEKLEREIERTERGGIKEIVMKTIN